MEGFHAAGLGLRDVFDRMPLPKVIGASIAVAGQTVIRELRHFQEFSQKESLGFPGQGSGAAEFHIFKEKIGAIESRQLMADPDPALVLDFRGSEGTEGGIQQFRNG